MWFLKRKLVVTTLIMMTRVTDGLGHPGGPGCPGVPGGSDDPGGTGGPGGSGGPVGPGGLCASGGPGVSYFIFVFHEEHRKYHEYPEY